MSGPQTTHTHSQKQGPLNPFWPMLLAPRFQCVPNQSLYPIPLRKLTQGHPTIPSAYTPDIAHCALLVDDQFPARAKIKCPPCRSQTALTATSGYIPSPVRSSNPKNLKAEPFEPCVTIIHLSHESERAVTHAILPLPLGCSRPADLLPNRPNSSLITRASIGACEMNLAFKRLIRDCLSN